MKQDDIKGLTDADLAQVITWAQDEQQARADKKKRETIAKIKELAGTVNVSVTINGQRGRPVAAKTPKPAKGAKA